jgi:hypothetical protein
VRLELTRTVVVVTFMTIRTRFRGCVGGIAHDMPPPMRVCVGASVTAGVEVVGRVERDLLTERVCIESAAA